jgi:2-oxoglutarate dehydrogenase complex dehydrogenase (E1) component-like enzyme
MTSEKDPETEEGDDYPLIERMALTLRGTLTMLKIADGGRLPFAIRHQIARAEAMLAEYAATKAADQTNADRKGNDE